MSTKDIHKNHEPSPPLGLGSSEGLGVFVGGPIWREHWQPRKVVGETSRSWVLEWGTKVPKKGDDPSCFAFSEAEIDQRAWVNENQHKIARMVERCHDHETLRKVAAVLGFETPNV